MCVDFLLFYSYLCDNKIEYMKKNKDEIHNSIHKSKYICIWRFVVEFLGLPITTSNYDDGLDYFLMGYLQNIEVLVNVWRLPGRQIKLKHNYLQLNYNK